MTDKQTGIIYIDGNIHYVGDIDCDSCWGDAPRMCKCGGVIHGEIVDEGTLYECDICGTITID